MKPERTVSFKETEIPSSELGKIFLDKWFVPELFTGETHNHVFLENIGETLKVLSKDFPKSDPNWRLADWKDRLSLLNIHDLHNHSGHSRIFKKFWMMINEKMDREKLYLPKGETFYIRDYDYLVTTPVLKSEEHAKEASDAIKLFKETGMLDYYYRNIFPLPRNLKIGSKMFYVDNRAIRGFAVVTSIDPKTDQTRMSVDTWRWIKPIYANYHLVKPPQSYAAALTHLYFSHIDTIKITGDWLDPMPTPKKPKK